MMNELTALQEACQYPRDERFIVDAELHRETGRYGTGDDLELLIETRFLKECDHYEQTIST